MLIGRIPNDRADHGAGRLAGAQESRAAKRGHVPRLRRHVLGPASRDRPPGRRAELPSALTLGPIVEHFLMQGGKLF